MHHRRHILRSLGALALAPLWGPALSTAQAQAPGMVHLLVGFPPGATGDRIARIVAPVFAANLGGAVMVDYKPGAGGQIAIDYTRGAAADGSTLLQTIGSSMVIYPHTYKALRYRPFEDFVPVGVAATAPIVLVTRGATPAKNLAEAVALMKRDRSYAFFGSPASGSVFHFLGVLLQNAMGSDFSHVPYKGSAPLMADALSGQVPFAMMAQSDILEHARAGTLRVLAVTGTARTSQLPDVPTFSELGYPTLTPREWFAYFLAKDTPADVVAKYRVALRKTVATPEVRARLAETGLEVGEGEAAPLAAAMQRESAQWKDVVKQIGFVAD